MLKISIMDNIIITIPQRVRILAIENIDNTFNPNYNGHNLTGQATDKPPGTENEFGYSVLAFIFTTAASFFTALSFTLMKYSINRDQRMRLNRPAYK